MGWIVLILILVLVHEVVSFFSETEKVDQREEKFLDFCEAVTQKMEKEESPEFREEIFQALKHFDKVGGEITDERRIRFLMHSRDIWYLDTSIIVGDYNNAVFFGEV